MKGVVNIITSSSLSNQCHQVTDYGWNDWWGTEDELNSWICFDFKDKKVSLTEYILKSDGSRGWHLLQWVIEGSNDGRCWKELDRRNTQDLNGTYITKSYDCESAKGTSFRYLRLRQTGKNSGGKDQLNLSKIEFFGTLHRGWSMKRAVSDGIAELKMEVAAMEETYAFTGYRFKGIISHLREQCGGNVHVKYVVNITASSNDYNQCHQVTDYGWNDCWYTRNEPNSWICFDFKEKIVKLTKYSLKSRYFDHLRQWVIEGSNDGSSWEELDKRKTKDLVKGDAETYECRREKDKYFRYLRLRKTSHGALYLAKLEFFGTIATDEKAAALRQRLIREEEDRRRLGKFLPCDDRPFWGIISHLSKECGGNVHVKGVVNITTSSNSSGQCLRVSDYGWNDYW